MLHDTVGVFTAPIRQKRLYVQWDVDPDVPAVVLGDEARIRQVLLNLVGNAVKFTDEGGIQLAVSRAAPLPAASDGTDTTEEEKVELAFTVTDTGIGIRQAELASLFQPFYQAESSGDRRHGGTGLGLAISKTLVELMGGRIAVSSEPGAGTCVSFTIAAALPASGAAALWEDEVKIS